MDWQNEWRSIRQSKTWGKSNVCSQVKQSVKEERNELKEFDPCPQIEYNIEIWFNRRYFAALQRKHRYTDMAEEFEIRGFFTLEFVYGGKHILSH